MKNISKYIVLAACAFLGTGAMAQSLSSGYFLEGYTFRHQMNPAFAPDKNFISIPALGNLNVGTVGNVGLGSFLYPYGGNGQLTTFMNESVSADQFLDGLKNNNRIGANINLTVLSCGFKAWGGFNTLEIGLRSTSCFNLPYELFEFMKLGQQGEQSIYHINDLGINSQTYAEIALGHSHQVNDRLRIGAKLKFLLGGAYADLKINNLTATMGGDKWMLEADGEMNAAAKGLIFPTKSETGTEITNEKQADLIDWDEVDLDNPGIGGMGVAVDLGASYELLDNLILSASLKDLGFISYSHNTHAVTQNEPWEFDGFHDIAIKSPMGDDDPNSLDSQLDKLGDDLEDYANLHRVAMDEKLGTMLAATLHVGAEYMMPFYRNLSVGLLSTTCFRGEHTWAEGRLSLNLSPCKWFDMGVNGSVSSYGQSWGWILNLHPKGFGFFLGMDQVVGKVSKQFIPINNMNMNISMGMNILF